MRPIDADILRERLQDLAYDDWNQGIIKSFADACNEIIEIVEEQPTVNAEPKWIPCSERLPDDDRTKVVTLANGNTECGYYSNGDWWCIGDSISLENPTVIAWMPLPEPYEEEE